ncbi:hypothetical protein CLU79DRAFT_833073 [Phycomyces nitens]|nr:hypothetical protein CLU79DRAFT_833073 [Phycomyces nitens]
MFRRSTRIITARSYALVPTDVLNQTSQPSGVVRPSYSVSMVAGRHGLKEQVELGGAIFPPGIQDFNGSRGLEQSSSLDLFLQTVTASNHGHRIVWFDDTGWGVLVVHSQRVRRSGVMKPSYSVSMVAGCHDLRKQVKLDGAIFPPGIQGSKGSRGLEQSSSVRQLL